MRSSNIFTEKIKNPSSGANLAEFPELVLPVELLLRHTKLLSVSVPLEVKLTKPTFALAT